MTNSRRFSLPTLIAGVLALCCATSSAYAADATFTRTGEGVRNVVSGSTGSDPIETLGFIGILKITIDGSAETDAYCIDYHTSIRRGDTVPQVNTDYPCEITYILNHAYPLADDIPTRLADPNREAAAVQSAVWYFSDGFVVAGPSDIQARAAEIIVAAESQCDAVPPTPHTIELSPESATNYLPDETLHTVTATLRDTDGNTVAGHPITVVVTGVAGPQTFVGVTDQSGDFVVTYENANDAPGMDTITASVSYVVPVGLKFKAFGKQAIVLAGEPREGSLEATASKSWVENTCGDGEHSQIGELCDDGNQIDGDGCDTNCTPSGCGNGVVTEGEQCDDGNTVDGDGCDANCTPTACGNGIVTLGEACDDGNAVDGDGCDANCTTSACGNGVKAGTEQCDDGNQTDGDGCDTDCTATACGNGIVTEGEQCDDGNAVNGDGCDTDCTATACGNGIVTEGEQCDDGNAVNGDGCDANCTATACGNGVVTEGEQCDDGNQVDGDACDSNCTAPACGNGIQTTSEQCDDGNQVDGDGCDANCTATACGNGVVTEGEQCDDGNQVDGDACDSNCTAPACGNGIQTAGEQCDDGNQIDGDGCDANCTITACGNQVVTEGEQCDDGNTANGDGCEDDCLVAYCGNGIVDTGEQCDDGNQVDGDGCSTTCRLTEICANQADDDLNGLVDCDDAACECAPIRRDPAVIRLRRNAPDFFKVWGLIRPSTAMDPAREGVAVILTNANGVIYEAHVPAAAMTQKRSRVVFNSRTARREGGIESVDMRPMPNGEIAFTFKAYGDFSAATLPTMSVQVTIGDDGFMHKGVWNQLRNGWSIYK